MNELNLTVSLILPAHSIKQPAMNQKEDIGSFLKDTKPLLKEYLETRFDLFRLHALRLISQSAGYLAWMLVSMLLALLILIFAGIVAGLWLSAIFHSHVVGFGLTTLLLLLVFAILALFRNALFVNPVIHAIIRRTSAEWEDEADFPE